MRISPSSRILNSRRKRHLLGFTLVEIMIVVALLSLISMLALPNVFRARKRAQATKVLDDLRAVDAAIEQYAIENQKADGVTVTWDDIATYMKTSSKLATSNGNDLLGNPYQRLETGKAPGLSDVTAEALAEVAPPEFWSPYR